MKRKAAPVLLIVILVLVALALGIANKIRTDRRSKRVAESLNRTQPEDGSVIHEGPGKASNLEAGSSFPEDPASPTGSSSPTKPNALRIDLAELRKAVLAGDRDAVDE